MFYIPFVFDTIYLTIYSKIPSYLGADGLLTLTLTCRRFGIGGDGVESLSLVEETARRIVQDIATEEEMAALPDGCIARVWQRELAMQI